MRSSKGLRSPETRQETAPPGLKAELRPYQQTGYAWLRFVARLGLGACLADDMGLGKTVQVISLLLDLKREPQRSRREPARRAGLADRELEGGAGEVRAEPRVRRGPSVGSEREAGEVGPADADAFDLVVTTYGMLVRTDWMKQHRWRLAILDEAQAIKNSGTKQTRAVKELTRRQPDRPDRHAGREPPVGSLVAVRLPEPRAAGHGQGSSARSSSGCKTPGRRRSSRCGTSCGRTSCAG